MEWLFYAFLTAILVSLTAIFQKGILKHEHVMEFSAVFTAMMAVISLIFIPKVNFAILNFKLLLIVYFFSWLSTLGFYFIMKALRHMEVSSLTPLFNLEVLFVAFLALVFLGESLRPINWFGIFILVLGTYFLQTNKLKNYLIFFKNIRKRYFFLILLSLSLYSFSSLADRYILSNFLDPITYLFLITIFIGVNFFLLHSLFHDGFAGIKKGFAANWELVVAIAIIAFAAHYVQFLAVSMADLALVIGIKRLSSLFSVLLGGELFHERNLVHKLIACLFMLIGAYFIII